MLEDGVPHLLDPLLLDRAGQHDRRPPGLFGPEPDGILDQAGLLCFIGGGRRVTEADYPCRLPVRNRLRCCFKGDRVREQCWKSTYRASQKLQAVLNNHMQFACGKARANSLQILAIFLI